MSLKYSILSGNKQFYEICILEILKTTNFNNSESWKYWNQPTLVTLDPGNTGTQSISTTLNPGNTGPQPILRTSNQTSQLDSHPGSHSIKPVNWTATLAVTQSNQSTGQPSWQSLNQTSQLDRHPGSHSIKPVSASWRPIGRVKGGSGGAAAPPGRIR